MYVNPVGTFHPSSIVITKFPSLYTTSAVGVNPSSTTAISVIHLMFDETKFVRHNNELSKTYLRYDKWFVLYNSFTASDFSIASYFMKLIA